MTRSRSSNKKSKQPKVELPTESKNNNKISNLSELMSSSILKTAEFFIWSPITLSIRVYKSISEIVGWKKLALFSIVNIVLLLGLHSFIFLADEQFFLCLNNAWDLIIKEEVKSRTKSWEAFVDENLMNVLSPLAYSLSLNKLVNNLNVVFERFAHKKLSDLLRRECFNTSIPVLMPLSSIPGMNGKMQYLPRDSEALSKGGSLIVDGVIKLLKGIFSLTELYRSKLLINLYPLPFAAVPIALFSVVYPLILHLPFQLIYYFDNKYTKQQIEIIDKVTPMAGYDFQNVKPIAYQKLNDIIYNSHKKFFNVVEKLKDKLSYLNDAVNSTLVMVNIKLSDLAYLGALGSNLYNGVISYASLGKFKYNLRTVSEVIGWSQKKFSDLRSIQQPLSKIEDFLKHKREISKIIKEELKDLVIESKKSKNSKFSVRVENFSLSLLDKSTKEPKTLINNVTLNFKQGNCYLITGEKGSGKSKFFSKLIGIYGDPGFKSKGKITYNTKNGKIAVVTQEDYFPHDKSIMELIFIEDNEVPKKDSVKYNKALDLLHETGIISKNGVDNKSHQIPISDLDKKDNWINRLSGGQKKIIKIISVLLREPDVLLLDEIFTGVDPQTQQVIVNEIKKYKKDMTIIAIEHLDLKNPNTIIKESNFYDKHLHLENSIFTEKDDLKTLATDEEITYEEFVALNPEKRKMIAEIIRGSEGGKDNKAKEYANGNGYHKPNDTKDNKRVNGF